MSLKNIKKELFKNEDFKKYYYDNSNLVFEVSENIIKARLMMGLTQEELAKRLFTKQSSISRLERGLDLPSLSFLARIADALGMKIKAPDFYVNLKANLESIRKK
ncbi:MAG: helix-turn-helix transcriptional regulator [Patescibacteria group bacterium]|jgi:transcriptional regulator with XRE-family HTH domain